MLRSVLAGFFYFLVVFGCGFVFGIIRTVVVAPRTGDTLAVLFELPFILMIAWYACRLIVRSMEIPPGLRGRLPMAITAFACLLAAEALLAAVLFGRPVSTPPPVFDSPAAALGFLGQVLFALFPLFTEPTRRKPT
jgi:hypothetical protein